MHPPTPVSTALPVAVEALFRASRAPGTRRVYASVLQSFDACGADGSRLYPETDDGVVLRILAMKQEGKAPATVRLLLAALAYRARLTDLPSPVGPKTKAVAEGYARLHADRGRGRARCLTAEEFAVMHAVAATPRRGMGGGMESDATAARRALVDRALMGVLFHGALRRSEAAALRRRDLQPARDGMVRVVLARSKTDQTGDAADVRLVKTPYAVSLWALADGDPDGLVFGLSAAQLSRRLAAAARAAGIEGVTAHSGRVTHASELIRRGAPTAAVMRSGGWATERMVAHYSAGAVAERGAVAKYL